MQDIYVPFGNIITYRRFKSNFKLKIHLLKANSVKIILMSSTSKACIKKQMQNWNLPFGFFYVGLSKKKLKMNPFFCCTIPLLHFDMDDL